MKCNNLNHIDYKYLQGSSDPWFCISCCNEIFPFGILTNKNFLSTISNCNPTTIKNSDANYISSSSSLALKPSANLSLLFNQFNNFSPEPKNESENVVNSNYQIQTLKFPEKSKSLSLFHINACSLSKNFNDLERLLKCTNKAFDIVTVSETRITQKTSLTSNINLQNYYLQFTPTESNAGGALLYIAKHLSYKPRTDLNLRTANQLESTFIEIINSRKSNIIVGCLYKHPSMDVSEFNKNYLNTLLDELSKENKQVFLLGDFNINLLNYNDHQPTNEFLDSLASNSFIPYILQTARITSHSKTLIDNIFSNIIFHEIISGNITATISDHLPYLPNFYLLLIYFRRHHAKNPIFMKEIGQNLFKQTLYLTILIKIGLMFSS